MHAGKVHIPVDQTWQSHLRNSGILAWGHISDDIQPPEISVFEYMAGDEVPHLVMDEKLRHDLPAAGRKVITKDALYQSRPEFVPRPSLSSCCSACLLVFQSAVHLRHAFLIKVQLFTSVARKQCSAHFDISRENGEQCRGRWRLEEA
ncbi:hypothetical protein ABVT39_014024 [Epinephelus coioides]